jgi:hypothetical protein
VIIYVLHVLPTTNQTQYTRNNCQTQEKYTEHRAIQKEKYIRQQYVIHKMDNSHSRPKARSMPDGMAIRRLEVKSRSKMVIFNDGNTPASA